ncbi:helix-turn-helix domain-containing protein [Spirillospora sp. CA-253888]
MTDGIASVREQERRVLDLRSWGAELQRVGRLSEREREVFALLGNGDSNRRIAARLGVAERTVKAHVAQIMTKIQVESRLQAGIVAFAFALLNESSIYGGP